MWEPMWDPTGDAWDTCEELLGELSLGEHWEYLDKLCALSELDNDSAMGGRGGKAIKLS